MKEKTARKRGRPPRSLGVDESPAKKRILETALRLFYRYGIHEVGIDRIIAEADIAKMTFYKYFPTKKDLVQAFLVERDEQFIEWVKRKFDSLTKEKRKKLPSIVDVMAIWFQSPDFRGCAFINTAVEIGPDGVEEKIICLSHKERLSTFVAHLAKEDGYKQPQRLAEGLVTLIDGATVRAQMGEIEQAIRIMNETAKILFKAYKSE